jgi:sugar phosphate isomerase/epimerase
MNLPDIAKGMILQQFTMFAKKSIEKLLKKTKIPTRKLAVESIEYPFENMIEVIEELDLSICLDTGHILAGYSGDISVLDFVNRYHKRICELHLHDGKYPRIDHKPLGTHDLPTRELLLRLKELEFAGPIVYELNLQGAKDSMEYIKKNVPEVL